jgi:phosphomannomutase
MKALFGTDGIRGEAGQFPLDPATVSAIGFSLASHLSTENKQLQIIIGRDTRESGEFIERALIAGATRAGAKVLSAGVITTPGVAFLTRKLDASAGVVISRNSAPAPGCGDIIPATAPTALAACAAFMRFHWSTITGRCVTRKPPPGSSTS